MTSATSASATPSTALPRNARLSAYYSRLSQTPSARPPAGPSSSAAVSSSSVSTPTQPSTVPALSSPTSASLPNASVATTSPTLRTDLPTGSGRQAVVDHANVLTQTLSLPDLMARCSTLRRQADRLASSLQTSSRAYYTHLSASSEAAQTASSIAQRLQPGVDAVASSCRMAAAIGQRLSMSRQRVDALHAVQRLSALRQAAATLAHKDLPNASADATAQLCTQPAEARARVLIAVQRAAIVVSAVETLAEKNDIDNNDPTTNGNSEFQTAAKNLRAAMLSMRRALSAHYFPSDHQTHDSFTDEDHQQQQHQQPHHYIRDGVHDYDYDSQVLSLEDATNSRLLLGDDMSSVKHDFFRAVAYYAAAPLPTAAAIAAAGKLRTGVARLHAVFCNAEVIPRMCDATRWYANIFSMSHNKPRTSNDGGDKLDDSEDHDGWHELMVCLSGVAEDAVAGRVRAALQSGSNNELSVEEIQGVASLVKAVKGLADGGSDPQEKEGTESVSAVLRACIHGLVGYIHTSVRDVAQRQLRSAFDAGANGSGNINKAAQAIQATVSEIASWGIDILFNNGEGVESDNNSQSDSTDRQTDDNGGASIKKVEMEKLIESAANSFTDPISSTFKQSARVATICDYLHEAYPGLGASGCSESLREASKQQARTAIGQALRQRLHTLSNDKSPQLAADLFTSAVTTLRDAEVVGKECDVPAMRRARDVDVDGSNGVGLDDGEQYAFLDDGWLARAVLRDWLAEIKTSSTNKKLTARVARTLQMDAAVLRQVVGYDVVDMVADAVEAGGQIFDSQFEKLDTRSALDLAMREKSNEYSNVMSHNL